MNTSPGFARPARELAWSGTAHGLFGELGVGTVTHSALQLGLALAGLFAGIGATLMLAGAGTIWVSRATPTPTERPQETETSQQDPALV